MENSDEVTRQTVIGYHSRVDSFTMSSGGGFIFGSNYPYFKHRERRLSGLLRI